MKSFSKRIAAVLLMLVIISACFVSSTFAASDSVVDGAGLLGADEEAKLAAEADKVYDEYGVSIVILTKESSYPKDLRAYSDEFYAENFIRGEDALILLIDIGWEEREFMITPYGRAENYFTSYGITYIEDEIISYLSDDNFYAGLSEFILLSGDFINEAQTDEPYSSSHIVPAPTTFFIVVAVLCVVAIIIGVIVVSVMKAKMNNARPNSMAQSYVRENSFKLNVSRDIYLYSTLRRVPKPKNNSSSGGRSSSRGGGGRRF